MNEFSPSQRKLFFFGALFSGASESGASSKNELQGSLDVTICGLQRPQHQLLILDPHVPELLHLGLPAALSKAQSIFAE